MAGWTETFRQVFIKEMKLKKKNGENFTEQDMELASYFKLSIKDIDSWEEKNEEEKVKKNYIKLIKKKKKNGEQITEGEMKWLESFKISLEDL